MNSSYSEIFQKEPISPKDNRVIIRYRNVSLFGFEFNEDEDEYFYYYQPATKRLRIPLQRKLNTKRRSKLLSPPSPLIVYPNFFFIFIFRSFFKV